MNASTVSKIQQGNVDIIRVENAFASLELSLFGGQVLSFSPRHDNRNRLWLSEKAIFDGITPIRGGIPICWPWFGAGPDKLISQFGKLPAHGFVRTCTWDIEQISDNESATVITLTPNIDYSTQVISALRVRLHITLSQTLTVALETTNVGKQSEFTAALHSYFAVNNIAAVEIQHITSPYWDKLSGQDTLPAPTPYVIDAETDRIHTEAVPQVLISALGDKTEITSEGHDSIVVWNPWKDKSHSMKDMTDDSYETMLCIETARTQHSAIAAGATHWLKQTIR
ncbi:D-hexose-6-phosphate mutarotase [Alteromonas facilis]|uniref:D-hexose-6-phosphate mutarotase n=1 Tax=Alteromonas facilis TaxID=2048004 RepID=UPI000C28CF22|nr:D-hexose-6-phosphate mutarotase [Alteromonas facilis]